MKICVINSIYKPYKRGGTENVVQNIVNGLKNRGHEVFVITIERYNKVRSLNFKKEKIEDTIVYRLYPLNIFSFLDIATAGAETRLFWHIIDVFNLHSYFLIKKILKQTKPDLVLTHNLKGLGYLTPKAVRKSKIKYIHTIHDVQLVNPSGLMIKNEEENKLNTGFAVGVYKFITRKLFSYPDVIISPSSWLLNYYIGHGFFKNSRKEVLFNPLYNIKSEAVLDDKNLEAEKNNNVINLGYVGQIEKYKGVDVLLEGFYEFSKMNKNCVLNIVGDGLELEYLSQKYQSEESIKFWGFIPNEKIGDIYRKIDILMVPSICYENSPTVICESFLHHVPVAASNIGGINELVKNNETGYLFTANQKDSIIEVIQKIYANRNELSSSGHKAYLSIKNQNMDNYLNRLEQIIKKI